MLQNKEKKKFQVTHACTEKMVNFIVIHVCMYVCFIDSAFFECLPWSMGVDIQFVRMLVCHQEWLSHQASSLQNTTA